TSIGCDRGTGDRGALRERAEGSGTPFSSRLTKEWFRAPEFFVQHGQIIATITKAVNSPSPWRRASGSPRPAGKPWAPSPGRRPGGPGPGGNRAGKGVIRDDLLAEDGLGGRGAAHRGEPAGDYPYGGDEQPNGAIDQPGGVLHVPGQHPRRDPL